MSQQYSFCFLLVFLLFQYALLFLDYYNISGQKFKYDFIWVLPHCSICPSYYMSDLVCVWNNFCQRMVFLFLRLEVIRRDFLIYSKFPVQHFGVVFGLWYLYFTKYKLPHPKKLKTFFKLKRPSFRQNEFIHVPIQMQLHKGNFLVVRKLC